MPSDRVSLWFPVLLIVALLLVSVVGGLVAVWRERRDPSSYQPPVPDEVGDQAWWALLPADEQEAYDTAVLDLAEQAELDAEDDAREAAQLAVERALDINTVYHP